MQLFGCPVVVSPAVPADELWIVNPVTGAVEDVRKVMRGPAPTPKEHNMETTANIRTTAAPLAQTIPASPAKDQGFANRLIRQSEMLRDKLHGIHESLDNVLGSGPRTSVPSAPSTDPSGQLEYIEQTLAYSHDMLDGLAARLNRL